MQPLHAPAYHTLPLPPLYLHQLYASGDERLLVKRLVLLDVDLDRASSPIQNAGAHKYVGWSGVGG